MENNKAIFEEGRDYYLKDGKVIMTEYYLIKKGRCCGSGCLFCPYEPFHTKGTTKLRNIPKDSY
jgi:hypothetical protein